jgi:hypothetical protein
MNKSSKTKKWGGALPLQAHLGQPTHKNLDKIMNKSTN